MDPKDLSLAAATGAVARISARFRKKLLKRAQRQHEMTYQEVIVQAEAKVTEGLRKRAHKCGLTDQEADALAENWKQAAKRTKHWKLPLRIQEPPNSGDSVGL
jgi:nitroimidazol reductase NimA-like FMN-containing flavoprotein (pyridoxamine 5'-phosphate oxidase superfamily)